MLFAVSVIDEILFILVKKPHRNLESNIFEFSNKYFGYQDLMVFFSDDSDDILEKGVL